MILDGINMEAGATRGTELVTRTIWKQLVARQSVDTLLTITCFSLAAYYKKIGKLEANVICLSISFLSNTIVLG